MEDDRESSRAYDMHLAKTRLSPKRHHDMDSMGTEDIAVPNRRLA